LSDGDKNAENQLFKKLSVRFRLFAGQRISNKEDCEEIVQKSLIVVVNKYKGIVFETSFSAWSHQVLKNEIMKYYRTKSNYEKMFLRDENNYTQPEIWDRDPVLKQKLLECMKKLCKTNTRFARVLNFKYQGFKAEDICEKLGISIGNIYVIVSRARSMLRHCLEKGELS
jgi:RNA polymerase sigma factor (sigma-70 family)